MNGQMNGWMRGRPLKWVLLGALLVLGSMSSAWAQNMFPTSGNVGIGTTNPSIGHLQVQGTETGQQIYAVSSATTGYNYGTDSEAYGSGATLNVGGFFYAMGAATNFGVQIYGPSAGAGYALYSNASAPSYFAGNVGIGTTSPAALLHVAGNAQVDGNIAAKYQDVAEWVPTTGTLGAGTVVIIDPQERNRVLPSAQPYDTRVAGVVSARPGLLLGEAGDDKAKVAQSGRVSVKVDASYGPIAVGDLLVTSPTPGHAMRSTPVDLGGVSIHRPGTLVGKALEPLKEGQGEILVLLTLQ